MGLKGKKPKHSKTPKSHRTVSTSSQNSNDTYPHLVPSSGNSNAVNPTNNVASSSQHVSHAPAPSDMSKSRFHPPANRRSLRGRAGLGGRGLTLGEGSFLPRIPPHLARKWPFSWLLGKASNVHKSGAPHHHHHHSSSGSFSGSQQWRWAMYLFVFVSVVVAFGAIGYQRWQVYQLRRLVYTPLNAPSMFTGSSDQNATNVQLFWGTYRPHLYFGMRHRSPHSLLGGLMWFPQGQSDLQLRHSCNAGQNLIYNWLRHNGRTFGAQEIHEPTDGYSLVTSFLKRPRGFLGGDWTARIRLVANAQSKYIKTARKKMPAVSLMFYFLLPDLNRGKLLPIIEKSEMIGIRGHSLELGPFQIRFLRPTNVPVSHVQHISYLASYVSREDEIQDVVLKGMAYTSRQTSTAAPKMIALMGHVKNQGDRMNLLVYEMTVTSDYELTVTFESGETFNRPTESLVGAEWDRLWRQQEQEFQEQFSERFPLQKFNHSKEEVEQGQTILSSLLGGMGYFHGYSEIRAPELFESGHPNVKESERVIIPYGPGSLFTATPSRMQFPRGFLWDEGFHQLVISRWDPNISLDVVAHWLQLMNGEGWIPREQILGLEAKARVPAEFIVQDHRNGNPPTLILPLLTLVEDSIAGGSSSVLQRHRETFQRALPRLDAWYNWFNNTQLGRNYSAYRWHGRTSDVHKLNPLTLTSGLDDYPRASEPTEEERHLDLRCWMALFSRLMAHLHEHMNSPTSVVQRYSAWAQELSREDLLVQLHWHEEANNATMSHFADYGLHSEAVQLVRPPLSPEHPYEMPAKRRVVRAPPQERYIPQRGYVTLFPLLTRILHPRSEKLKHMLTMLDSEAEGLWTPYGLRSLSKHASLYQRHNTEHDPPYWRGAIWINMNYLAVRALSYYAHENVGPHSPLAESLYRRLRHNLVSNILREFSRTGFLWEQYDDVTGLGQKAHPFTGWTSLVLLIMADR